MAIFTYPPLLTSNMKRLMLCVMSYIMIFFVVACGGSAVELDDDDDGIVNRQDQCPNTPINTPVDSVGCAIPIVVPPVDTGESLFADKCLACHGNQGNGGIRPLNYELYDTKAMLSQVITNTMPKNNASDCEQSCADLITDYVWAANNLTENTSGGGGYRPPASYAIEIPAMIEAEAYHAYLDNSDNNEGNCSNNSTYGSAVDLNRTFGNEPSGCYVGYVEAGEWLEYELSVPIGGRFQFSFRLASNDPGKRIEIFLNDVSIGVADAPGQGWGHYDDVLINELALSNGGHTLRIVMLTGGLDINNFNVVQTQIRPQDINTYSGEQIYHTICAECHGPTGVEGTSAYAGITFTDEFGDSKYTRETLTNKILIDMPFGNASYCDEECSSKVTDYLWDLHDLGALVAVDCSSGTASQQQKNSPLRMLNVQQYARLLDNTFPELSLDIPTLMRLLPGDTSVAGFPNNAGVSATTLYLQGLIELAERVANEAVPRKASILNNCSLNNSQCVNDFIRQYGKPLFRRSVDDEELQRLRATFNRVQSDTDQDTAFKSLLMSMLLDAQTLYYAEENVPQRRMLTKEELLSKLAFFLWNEGPDAALIDQVASSNLSTVSQVRSLVEQMLEDERAAQGLAYFYYNWLNVNSFGGFELSGESFDNAVFAKELSDFVNYLTFTDERQGTFSDLLVDKTAFLKKGYGQFYDVDNNLLSTSGVTQVQLGVRRSGILTRSAYLQSLANNEHSSITLRGLKLREKLLCQHIESPSADVQNQFPKVEDGVDRTPIEFFTEVHLTVDGCAGCHAFMDPIGFAFEQYDGFGLYRTHYENGASVDYGSQSYIKAMVGQESDISGDFNDVLDLSNKLANSSRAQSCFVKQWYRNAFTRNLEREDRCAFEALVDDFENKNYSLKDIIISIATSDAFIYRNPE